MLLGACGRQAPETSTPAATPEIDVMATVLAAQLPPGASACAVAQPRWVSVERRRLLSPLTGVDPVAWGASSVIDVYAEAQQRDRVGPGASVRLIRFRGALSALREYVADELRFDVRWDEEPTACRPDHCVISARRIAPDVVRFDRGLWRDRGPGVETRCAAMARAYPQAAELSYRGADEMAFVGGMVPLVASARRIEVGEQMVRVVQRDEMDSVEAARVLAQASVDLLRGRAESFGGMRREQNGNFVISTTELTWEDLRMGIDDRKRDSENRRYAELLVALEPDDGIDPRQMPHALDQLRVRAGLLKYEPISSTLLRATVSLAERIQSANPTDVESAFLLAGIYLRHTHESDKAVVLINRHAPTDPRVSRWRELSDLLPSAGEEAPGSSVERDALRERQ